MTEYKASQGKELCWHEEVRKKHQGKEHLIVQGVAVGALPAVIRIGQIEARVAAQVQVLILY